MLSMSDIFVDIVGAVPLSAMVLTGPPSVVALVLLLVAPPVIPGPSDGVRGAGIAGGGDGGTGGSLGGDGPNGGLGGSGGDGGYGG